MNTSECYLKRAITVADTPVANIINALLDDRDATHEHTAQLVSPYIQGGVTTLQVRKHRNGTCGCGIRAAALGDLTSPGEGSPDPRRERHAPKGWEPGVRYDKTTGQPTEIITPPIPEARTENDYLTAIREMGAVLPDGYTVRLLHASYDPAAWTRQYPGEDAVTRAVWRYKFAVIPVEDKTTVQNTEEIINIIANHKRAKKQPPATTDNGVAFVIAYADLQIGKIDDAGGTTETIARILAKTDDAVRRLKDLRKTGRNINSIYVMLMGDCVEGFSSQNGRLAFRQDITPTEQIRVYRRLLIHIVNVLTPLAERLVVAVVPGNHDDAQRNLVTKHNDDFATEGAAAVADALLLNPTVYEHVSFVFTNDDRSVVTLDVEGTIVALAHGHQMRGVNGAENWWKGQAHGMQPAGDATLLITAHFHHLRIIQSGIKTHMQCPALDNGSRWFTEKTGCEAPAGLLTMTVGHGVWNDLQIL